MLQGISGVFLVRRNPGTSLRHPLVKLFLPSEVLIALLVCLVAVRVWYPECDFNVVQLLPLELLDLSFRNNRCVPISRAVKAIDSHTHGHACPKFLVFFTSITAWGYLWTPQLHVTIASLAVILELDPQFLILD